MPCPWRAWPPSLLLWSYEAAGSFWSLGSILSMNKESPWKKNPLLNAGVLVLSVGTLTLTFFDRAQLPGTIIAIIGFIMFFVGYRKAKASGAPPVPVNERRRKLRIMMICLAITFLVSPIMLWPQISKLRGPGVWVFAIGTLVGFLGILSFYLWLYKKAGQDKSDGV